MNIISALKDKNLLGRFIDDPSTWRRWFTFLRAFFALPPAHDDMETYTKCTGRTVWPTSPAREAWIICGRRAGKTIIAAFLAVYFAVFKKYKLTAGETAYVIIVSPSLNQSQIIKGYLSGIFNSPMFRSLVLRESQREIILKGNVGIVTIAGDYRATRGYTGLAVILDELGFFQSDGASPDTEVLRSLRPTLATTGGPLIVLSTPFTKRGELWKAYRDRYGKDDDPVLIWQSNSIEMNPTLSKDAIDRARQDDPVGSASEWDGLFRADSEGLFTASLLAECVERGRGIKIFPTRRGP